MVLLSCLNYFSCGVTNELNYETCVDHVHSLDSAMVACITPLASLSIVDIIIAMSVDNRRDCLRHNKCRRHRILFTLNSVFRPTAAAHDWSTVSGLNLRHAFEAQHVTPSSTLNNTEAEIIGSCATLLLTWNVTMLLSDLDDNTQPILIFTTHYYIFITVEYRNS